MVKRKIFQNIAKSRPGRIFRKKLQEEGLFLALAIISTIGFYFNTLNLFKDNILPPWWISFILGLGLIYESKIRSVISGKSPQRIFVLKVNTFLVGAAIAFSGIMTFLAPLVGIMIDESVIGAVAFANLLALFVIIVEIFFVD